MGGLKGVEVINSKGCSRFFAGFSSSVPSFRSLQSFEPMSLASTSLDSESLTVRSTGPFSCLVICVTALSKEATERLGGQYSPSLHSQCTNLVIQSVSGRKFEHALEHGSRNGLVVVILGWVADSVKGKDSFSGGDVFFDANGDDKDPVASFTNLIRSLTESEKNKLIFKDHFLTVLDYIYAFYQENMSAHEIEAAIHTNSRHADRLRAAYSSKEMAECGYVIFKRIDFLVSRRSFEMLKRVSGDKNSNVYELFIRG